MSDKTPIGLGNTDGELIQLSYLNDPRWNEIVDQPGEVYDDPCPDCGRVNCLHVRTDVDEFECTHDRADEKSDYERDDR